MAASCHHQKQKKPEPAQIRFNEPCTDYDKADRLTSGANIIFYGVPGSGKSRTIKTNIVTMRIIWNVWFFTRLYVLRFAGQIMPAANDAGRVTYEFAPGLFTKLLKKAYDS